MKSFYRYLSLNVWGKLPPRLQHKISAGYASLYNRKFTRHFIKFYTRWNYADTSYLDKFVPASGSSEYQSFQDFFTRKFKNPPRVQSSIVWPCEGLLCESESVSDTLVANVKGEKKYVREIFGRAGKTIPSNYHFANVFLHNNNYHRIHSPVSGTITSIERVPGELVLLRPWIYTNEPSLPAMINERVNLTIDDTLGKTWYLSIVGGPAVGTIRMSKKITKYAQVVVGEEVGLFLLGSTCCIVSPQPIATEVGSLVEAVQPII